jgi:hypothetical protein
MKPLYKSEYNYWFYEGDILKWAGVGGCVTLSILELKKVLKRIEKLEKNECKAK